MLPTTVHHIEYYFSMNARGADSQPAGASKMRNYFAVTLWRAILKFATIITLGVIWLANLDSTLAMGVFVGACILWVIDGCDHGIDNIRRRAKARAG